VGERSSLSCQECVIALLVSYLNTLQAQGRIASLPLPSEELAPAACAYADDTKSPSIQPHQDGLAIKEAFALARAAGMPALNAAMTCLLPLFTGPTPPCSISLGVDASSATTKRSPKGLPRFECLFSVLCHSSTF
jgi:hypothetical protein